jgi:hypothetical protein
MRSTAKKLNPVRERAKHHLYGFLENVSALTGDFNGHFEVWLRKRRRHTYDRVLAWDVGTVMVDLCKILYATADWSRPPTSRELKSLDGLRELKILAAHVGGVGHVYHFDGTPVEVTIRRSKDSFDTFVLVAPLMRQAADHLFRYLNTIAICGPIHWACQQCGKLAITRPGSNGEYCSNLCRKEMKRKIMEWKTPEGVSVQALAMQEWRAQKTMEKLRKELKDQNPKQTVTRDRLKKAKADHDAKWQRYEDALKLASKATVCKPTS